MTWPFGDLRTFHYGVVLADPPWDFKTWTRDYAAKTPSRHYRTQHLSWIKSLPVAQLARDACALVLWGTAPMIRQALEVLDAWGFRFVTMGSWAKESRGGSGKVHFGTGYVLRNAAEFYIVGARGRPRVRSHSVRNLIWEPVREHSRKPDQMHRDIERLFDGPYCEIFARQRRRRWDSWGNELDKFAGVA